LTRRRFFWVGLVLIVFAGGFALLQIDLVRQNLEIAWIQISGTGWHLHGTSRTLRMWSPALKESRNVIVYLPPGYISGTAGTRYPVLYLLHGSPDPGYGWSRYGRAQEEVDRLIVDDNYPPMIVVMPDGNGQGTLGDSEYIDAPAKQRNGKPGLRVGTFIVKDVVNWTDSHYRSIQTPRGRLIGGISTGAYGSANLGLQNPQIFGTIMSFSGYYKADSSGWARPVWGRHPSAGEIYSQSPEEFVTANPKKYEDDCVILGDGASDRSYYRSDTDRFYKILSDSHIQVKKFQFPGRHSWDLWRILLQTSLTTVQNRVPVDSTDSH
jgi:enterochelin esterase-like enzyme